MMEKPHGSCDRENKDSPRCLYPEPWDLQILPLHSRVSGEGERRSLYHLSEPAVQSLESSSPQLMSPQSRGAPCDVKTSRKKNPSNSVGIWNGPQVSCSYSLKAVAIQDLLIHHNNASFHYSCFPTKISQKIYNPGRFFFLFTFL